MELFIVGLLFGFSIGAIMVKVKRDDEREELEELLIEADELINMQKKYIEQRG